MDDVRVTKHTTYYEKLTAEMRPQDDAQDGSDLTFDTSEHGGEYPDSFPEVITVTDSEGRWCRYEPIRVGGSVVRSHGSFFLQNVSKKKCGDRDSEELLQKLTK